MSENRQLPEYAPGVTGLAKFLETEGHTEGVDVRTLPADTVISFRTENSQYHFLLENPQTGEGKIIGGSRFKMPGAARINGSKIGNSSSMIVTSTFQKGMLAELQVDENISPTGILNTSPIVEIYTSQDKTMFKNNLE